MGWLGDMLDKRRLVMGLLLALSVSVGVMGWAASSFLFTTFMIVYSLAYGGLASLQEPIRADYFGTKAFATIQGVSRSITTAGTFLGPIIAGLFYDFTRSYSLAFTIFAAVSLVSTVLMFLARRPMQKLQAAAPAVAP
jgi:MFS family permease